MTTARRSAESLTCLLLLILVSACNRAPEFTTQSPEALRAYKEGLGYFDKFYYREAKASFEEALRKDSTFAMAWARLARLDHMNSDVEQARRDMDRALRLGARASEHEQLLIRIFDQGLNYNVTGAAATTDTLIARYPHDREGYLLRGNMYEQMKDLKAAIHSYEQAIKVDTSYALAAMSLGYAYSKVGETEKAATQMQRYIRLAPDAADPHASYADILLYMGRYDEALEHYRKSLELKPDFWYSFRKTGEIYEKMGRLKEAEEQFHASLKLIPQNRQAEAAHYELDGLLSLDRGNYDEALRQYHQALAIDSNNFDAARGIVYALSKQKKFDEAAPVIDRFEKEFERKNLAQAPIMLWFYLMQSDLLTEKGDLERALAACDSAVGFSTNQTRGIVYRQMAEIYRRQKAFESALDACEQALEVNPNAPEVLLTLVKIYSDRGDRRMTREIGSRLMQFWAHADPDYQHRNELMRILGVTS